MAMDFGHCGIPTALSLTIPDMLCNLSFLQTRALTLSLNPEAKIKKLTTKSRIELCLFIWDYFCLIISFLPVIYVLLIYNPHWLMKILEDYVLLVYEIVEDYALNVNRFRFPYINGNRCES